jgi:hypothetical protein
MASLAQRGMGIVPKRRDINNLSRGERLQIMLSPDELTAVDDFRFQHRMPSRAAAVRELFRIGLANAGLAHNSDGKRSSDIGVLEAAADLANPPGLRMVSKDGSSA